MIIDITNLAKYNCDIKTDSGYEYVSNTITKEEDCIELHFSDWTILKVSKNHLFEISGNEWKLAQLLDANDSILSENGVISLLASYDIGIQTVYDLTVDTDKHQYYLDGVSSHNTGKNLITMSGCCYLMDKKQSPYEGIVYIRANIDSIDDKSMEYGFLKGSLLEKMDPYLMPLNDSITTLVRKKYKVAIGKDRNALDEKIEEFKEKYNIKAMAINFLRGGTINNSLVIIDECQNLSISSIKLILTRMGDNTKVFMLGDVQQGDSKYLNQLNNSLTHMLNLVNKEDIRIVGLDFNKTIRSKIAGWAADEL